MWMRFHEMGKDFQSKLFKRVVKQELFTLMNKTRINSFLNTY